MFCFLGEQAPGGALLFVCKNSYILGYGSCLIMGNISCFHVPLKYAVILGGLQCLLTNCQPFSFLSEEKKSLQFPKLHSLSHLWIETSSWELNKMLQVQDWRNSCKTNKKWNMAFYQIPGLLIDHDEHRTIRNCVRLNQMQNLAICYMFVKRVKRI